MGEMTEIVSKSGGMEIVEYRSVPQFRAMARSVRFACSELKKRQ
jgi:hypothetical protein